MLVATPHEALFINPAIFVQVFAMVELLEVAGTDTWTVKWASVNPNVPLLSAWRVGTFALLWGRPVHCFRQFASSVWVVDATRAARAHGSTQQAVLEAGGSAGEDSAASAAGAGAGAGAGDEVCDFTRSHTTTARRRTRVAVATATRHIV